MNDNDISFFSSSDGTCAAFVRERGLVTEPDTRENLCLNGGFSADGNWFVGINRVMFTETRKSALKDRRCIHVFRKFGYLR